GQVTAVLALAALAAGLIEAGRLGLSDPLVLGCLALFAAGLAAFGLIEARSAEPMLPLALFRRSAFGAPVLIGLLVNVSFYGLIFLFSLLFQSQLRFSPLAAGVAFLPMTAAIMAANLASRRLAARAGPARTVRSGVLIMLAGCAGLLWAGQSSGYPAMLAQQLLLGAGLGLLVPPMTGTLLGSVARSRSGVAAGTLTTMRQAGSMLGVALFGSLAAGAGRFYPGLHAALLISVAVLSASAALTFLFTSPAQGRPPSQGGGERGPLEGKRPPKTFRRWAVHLPVT
ncbi:MAG: MFS transporter, partial [Actinobacteria bacterium]|nr:MFS transporter [Actinomycetota bacterium]